MEALRRQVYLVHKGCKEPETCHGYRWFQSVWQLQHDLQHVATTCYALKSSTMECVNPANCFMSLLIPGPKSPGKDFDVFLEPLIEELLQLWSGFMTYDAASRTKFNMHAAVLWSINDYPALGTLSGQTTKGYYACVHCDKNPLSRRLKNKIGYTGHRRYLPTDHDWCKYTKEFDGNTEE